MTPDLGGLVHETDPALWVLFVGFALMSAALLIGTLLTVAILALLG